MGTLDDSREIPGCHLLGYSARQRRLHRRRPNSAGAGKSHRRILETARAAQTEVERKHS